MPQLAAMRRVDGKKPFASCASERCCAREYHCGMHVHTTVFLVAFACAAPARHAGACEPCEHVLDLDASLAKATLVVVGRRTDYAPAERERWVRQQGPDTIDVAVERVLKGDAPARITVDSWAGMCPYGIVVDGDRYVMILTGGPPVYHSLDSGCGVKVLPVVGDLVDVGGGELATIDALEGRLGR
ncbi:MAG TPA: hypothetical protein VFO79_07295 [Xanthomonadales bacterium]|nr:hypothetical protein [Xanthomonadales bacterium]